MKRVFIYILSKSGRPFYIGKLKNINSRHKDHMIKYGTFEKSILCTCLEKDVLAIEGFLIGRYTSMGYKLENRIHNREQKNIVSIKEYAERCNVFEQAIRIKIKQGKISIVQGRKKAYIDILLNPIKKHRKKIKMTEVKKKTMENPAQDNIYKKHIIQVKGHSILEHLKPNE